MYVLLCERVLGITHGISGDECILKKLGKGVFNSRDERGVLTPVKTL